MKPIAAAVAAALVSGVAMFTLGARTTQVDAFAQPALVQTIDGQYVEVAQPARFATALRPVAQPATLRPVAQQATVQRVAGRTATRAVTPARTVYTEPAAQERIVYADVEEAKPKRSWGKTAMIIGGSAAGGAGVGAIAGGRKGAMIGAAIGGGAASIYEATRRR